MNYDLDPLTIYWVINYTMVYPNWAWPHSDFLGQFYIILHLYSCRRVMVEWIRRRTVDHKVHGSSPAAAPMSFGKTLIYICHTPPMWSKWYLVGIYSLNQSVRDSFTAKASEGNYAALL